MDNSPSVNTTHGGSKENFKPFIPMPRLRQALLSELILILVAQLIIELVYFMLGVRMDIYPILGYWQLVDPLLLKTDLLRSVFYFHIQPPGFNLLIGVILKLFPSSYALVLQAFHFVLGITALWSIFELQLRFKVPRPLALFLTITFGASPGYILFEHHTLYTFLVATLWTTSALILHNYLMSRRFRWLLAFFTLIWFLAWTRALVHIVYVILILTLIWYKIRPISWKQAVAAIVLVIMVLVPYAKNYAVFGKFTQSTWFPGNLAKVVLFPIAFQKRLKLYHNKVISKYSAFIWQPDPKKKVESSQDEAFPTYVDERGNPFWSSPKFLKQFSYLPRIPVLISYKKSTSTKNNDMPNPNYVAMIGSYDKVMKDDIKVAIMYPNVVLTSWLYSFLIYFTPSHIQEYLSSDNKKAAAPMIGLYDRLYGKVRVPALHDMALWLKAHWDYVPFINPHHIYIILLFGLPLVLLLGIRMYRHMQEGPDRTLLLYVLVTVLFVMLIGNLADCGENNRFRFNSDFFYVFLTGLAITPLVQKITSYLRPSRKNVQNRD